MTIQVRHHTDDRERKPDVTSLDIELYFWRREDEQNVEQITFRAPGYTVGYMRCYIRRTGKGYAVDLARWIGPPVNLNGRDKDHLSRVLVDRLQTHLRQNVKAIRTDLIDLDSSDEGL